MEYGKNVFKKGTKFLIYFAVFSINTLDCMDCNAMEKDFPPLTNRRIPASVPTKPQPIYKTNNSTRSCRHT